MDLNTLIVARGDFYFARSVSSNSQILHYMTQNTRLEGYAVERISIFENPMMAIVQLSPLARHRMPKRHFLRPKSTPLDRSLIVTFRLPEEHQPENRQRISYRIECSADRKLKEWKRTSSISDRLSRNIMKSLKKLDAPKPRSFPYLVHSS
jgi:hypothetical protein